MVMLKHNNDVIMGTTASQISSLTIVYSIVYLGADQRKHQVSVSLAFVRGIHRGPVNSRHKGPVTRKMFPFDDVIMHFVILLGFIFLPRDTLLFENCDHLQLINEDCLYLVIIHFCSEKHAHISNLHDGYHNDVLFKHNEYQNKHTWYQHKHVV